MCLEIINEEKILEFKKVFEGMFSENHQSERFTNGWLDPFKTYLKVRSLQSNRKLECKTDDEIKKVIREFNNDYIGDFDDKYDFVRSELLFRAEYCSKDVFDLFMEFIDYDKVTEKLGLVFSNGYGYEI